MTAVFLLVVIMPFAFREAFASPTCHAQARWSPKECLLGCGFGLQPMQSVRERNEVKSELRECVFMVFVTLDADHAGFYIVDQGFRF